MQDIKTLPVDSGLFPLAARKSELAGKHERIRQFLDRQNKDALLLMRHENIAWSTAGIAEMRVAIPNETAVGWLLFTRTGGRYYLTTENEAPRLAAEEFSHLDFQPILRPWYDADWLSDLRKRIDVGAIVGDHAASGLPVVSLQPLRLVLTSGEIERYRWLGKHTAEATAELLIRLRPGMKEADMQAQVAEALFARGILPTVFLMATDQRILKYRHAVPRNGVLEKFGMLNLCARRWGLAVSITRYVHFGKMPEDLRNKFRAAAQVYVRLLQATRTDTTSDALFHVARAAYVEAAFPGEEQMHHQGGATGYVEREWVARPGGKDIVANSQAFAWNPSVQGAKIEDTVLLLEHATKSGPTPSDPIETLTKTPTLPIEETEWAGSVYRTPAVLEV